MVSENPKHRKAAAEDMESPEALAAWAAAFIKPGTEGDPQSYVTAATGVLNLAMRKEIKPLDATRLQDLLATQCKIMTGLELTDVAARGQDPIKRFIDIMSHGEEELQAVEAAYLKIDSIQDSLKKKWSDMIRRVIILQRGARADPAKFMAYVFRDADERRAGKVLEFEWFHLAYFQTWNDPAYQNSLVMAPPGHGKSFCLRAQAAWEVGNSPELRCLLLADAREKCTKEIPLMRGILECPRYKAVFPNIRVLTRTAKRSDDDKQTASVRNMCFTVGRKNQAMSREATFEAASTLSNINGSGFERIYPDDWFPPDVADHPQRRREFNRQWDSVIQERIRDPENSRIRGICTPWDEDDPAGRIRRMAEEGKLPSWKVDVDRYAIMDDEKGDPIPLWPRKYGVAVLKEKRFRQGHLYDCTHRLKASRARRKALTKVWWYCADAGHPLATANDKRIAEELGKGERYLSIDPAASAGYASSDTGVIDATLLRNGYGLITDVWYHHLEVGPLLDWIVHRILDAWRQDGMERRPYKAVFIEGQGGIKGQSISFSMMVPDRLKAAGMPPRLIPEITTPGTRLGEYTYNRGKFKRLCDAAPWIQDGYVRFAGTRERLPKASPGMVAVDATEAVPIRGGPIHRLVEYAMEFDGDARKADGLDALVQWVLLMSPRLANREKKAAAIETTAAPASRNNPVARALRDALRRLRQTDDEDTIAREGEFLQAKFGMVMDESAAADEEEMVAA